MLPALARAYELPSFSGSESVGVTKVLMLVENPSSEIKEAVKAAMEWFVGAKLLNISTKQVPNATGPNGYDVIVYKTPGTTTWGRFYDLQTNLPFFCGRDGIKKSTLAEIEIERRAGYAWYGLWPATLITTDYNNWKSKNGI